MEQNPTSTNAQTAPAKPQLTKPQLWLLGGAILIGIALEIWLEQDFYFTYSILWLDARGLRRVQLEARDLEQDRARADLADAGAQRHFDVRL